MGFEGPAEIKESLASLKEQAEATIQLLLEKTPRQASKGAIEIEELLRMCNGELLFQFNTKEAAEWVKEPGK